MLMPMLLAIGALRRRSDRRGGDDGGRTRLSMPIAWFVFAFIGVMLLNSSFTLHPQLRRLILDVDQFLFLMVMIALGLGTQLARLGQGGVGMRLLGLGAFGLVLSSSRTRS